MAARTSLREYQRALSERLRGAEAAAGARSKLGLRVGGQSWLVDLTEAGELIPVPALTRVPLTRAWFRGVVNVRGNLYNVVDFAAFLGGPATPAGDAARLLLLADRFVMRGALLVDGALGLREAGALQALEEAPAAGPWVRAQYQDAQGQRWMELDVAALAAHAAFLEVAA